MIGKGMVRRAATYLRALEQRAGVDPATVANNSMRSAADAMDFRRTDVYRGSDPRASADRTMREFIIQRPNAPGVAFAHAERGFAALETADDENAATYLSAADHLGAAAERAKADLSTRLDTTYRDLAHLALFWQGASRANAGLFKEAIESFEECVKVHPNGPYADRAIFAVGQTYERNGGAQEAAEAYARIRRDHPRGPMNVAARLRESQMYLRRRQPELALDVLVGLDKILDAEKASDTSVIQPQMLASDAREQLSVLRLAAALQRQRHASALDTATAFLAGHPSSQHAPLVRLYAGYAALNLDSNALALRQLDQVLLDVPNNSSPIRQQALLYRALALRRNGNADAAGASFADLSARSDYPYQAQALVEVGQGAYQRGDLEGARKALERAERSSLDPSTTIRARLLLGAVLVEQQKWNEAASIYERAEQLAASATTEFLPFKKRYIAESRLKQGICLAQENNREQAIKALTEYLGNHPDDPGRDEGTFWLAEMMYRSDLLRNAQELYEEIVYRYTASIRREEALYGLGWTHFRKREFDKSVKVFGQMIEAYPKSKYAVDALVRRGDGFYVTRQYQAAARQYEEASRRSPKSEEGLYAGYQVGQALYRAGDLAEASTRLRAYVSANSNSRLADDALYLAGWIAFQQRDDATAVAEFQRLLDAYPGGDQAVRALYTQGDAKYNLGDIDGALACYRQLMERYPMHPLSSAAARSMQSVLVAEGRTEEALAVSDALISANPESPVAREFAWEKANIFYSGRNFKSAADELQAYMAKYPTGEQVDDALFMLGKSYLTMDGLDQARDAFADLERRFPASELVPLSKLELADYHRDQARAGSADSLYTIVQQRFASDTASASRAGFERASIARLKGDTLGALQLHRSVADLYPGTEYGDQSRYQLALYYRGKRLPDSARAELAVLVRTSATPLVRANALYDIGDTYARQRMWEEAIPYFEQVRTDYAGHEDWYTLSLIGLGACHEQLGSFDKAREVYSVVAQLRSEDDYGKTALARLKRLEKKP
jgi:TolA-binding protein